MSRNAVRARPRGLRPRRLLGHVEGLDGLRGLAVALVMAYHLPLTVRFVPGGTVGVDIFFVLSGFLITALLLERLSRRDRRSEVKRFYARRAARLGPALLAFLAVWCLLWAVTGGHGFFNAGVGRDPHAAPVDAATNVRGLVAVLTYSYNWVAAAHLPVPLHFGHLWSLSVEEHFYLVWPALLLLLTRLRRRWVAPAVVVTLIAGSALAAVLHSPAHQYAWSYYGSASRAQALLVGALLALLWSSDRLRLPRPASMVAGLAGAVVLAWCAAGGLDEHGWLGSHGGFTLAAVAAGGVVLAVVERASGPLRLLEGRPLLWLGRRSYALYVWSFPITMWTAGLARPQQAALVLALSAAVAEASWHLVERPAQRWVRDRQRGSAARGREPGADRGQVLVLRPALRPLPTVAPAEQAQQR